MNDNKNKFNLFISYSHEDEQQKNNFIKHITPLKDKGLIDEWHDTKILPGEKFMEEIDANLANAEIICLLVSADYLQSGPCKAEKNEALKMRRANNTLVVPIILKECGWKDYDQLSQLLALPKDGKPVSSFNDKDKAWNSVYEKLRDLLKKRIKYKQISINENFSYFLNSTEMLEKFHPRKKEVELDDIFTYPEVEKIDILEEDNITICFKEIIDNIIDYSKIIIAGEDLSGKTTLCKTIYKKYREINLFPVYINDKVNSYSGKIENKIKEGFINQYETDGIEFNDINSNNIVPILDDFHSATKKEKIINGLRKFERCVLIFDDIQSFNIGLKDVVSSFDYFKIKDFKPSLRYELIKKWVNLSGKKGDNYKFVDRKIDLINDILGKSIGKGIMSAYPFFILSTVASHETYKPLDREGISSQGYCYQAFIYFYLREQGVTGDKIDTYLNFLTELAFHYYEENKEELNKREFDLFMKGYLEDYNMPVKKDVLLDNIKSIFSRDCFNNYSFKYPYLYYFFTAKYFAENINNCGIVTEINKIINNLHVDEYAFITIFLTHHTKNIEILEELLLNSMCLFEDYSSATLSKDELSIFEEKAEYIIEAALPPLNSTPEHERKRKLDIQDQQENKNKKEKLDNLFEKELRRAIKTVEVMGIVIKNRSGSLKKDKLEELFENGMDVHLRILSYFFEIIKHENEIIDIISKRLKEISENTDEDLQKQDLKEKSRFIFWNLNFLVNFGIINKVVHSVGSDNLIDIVYNVCDKKNTMASFLIKQGILMWYDKNLQIEELVKAYENNNVSEIVKRTIKLLVSNYSRYHKIEYKNRQRLEDKFNFPPKRLLNK